MNNVAARNSRVEMAAISEAKRSMILYTDLTPSNPEVDLGIDLLGFRPFPFAAYPVQVKGTTSGMKVWQQYALQPTVLLYVINPMSPDTETFVMTGEDAWKLPMRYVDAGGKASDFHAENLNHYRWPKITSRLSDMLHEHYLDDNETWTRVLDDIDRGHAQQRLTRRV